MPKFYPARSASLVITLLGTVTNFALAVQVLAAWRSLKWEPESEWETSAGRIDSVKLVWGLLLAYFAAATTVCTLGFVGIVKSKPSLVRFYRDYSIADFSFCTFFTIVGTYGAFHTTVGAGVCEELSRQPELMRDMVEMGLNLENCERWFERAVLVSMAIMIILIVVRLHFLIAVSNFYSHLSRHHQRAGTLPTHSRSHSRSKSQDSIQRIYLLPRPSTTITTTPQNQPSENSTTNDVLVYAPVPLSSLTPQAAQDLRASATEAWISRTEPDRAHSHSHRHRYHHSSSDSTGRISLPIQPNEPLLPSYEDMTPIKA